MQDHAHSDINPRVNPESDITLDPMDPGHVDFVLIVSEQHSIPDGLISNAMPVSKFTSVFACLLGLALLMLGVDFLIASAVEPRSDETSTPISLGIFTGVGCITMGGLLIAIALKSFLSFIHEVLELAD